jgi:DNA-binding XRE family transcriptional regulator
LARKPGSTFGVAGEGVKIKMLYIINIKAIFVDNKQQIVMNRKKQVVFPKYQKILEQVGENIKLARKRRKLTTLQVAERAGIDRTTLYHIEKGNSSVSMAAYFNTLRVLGLQDDFLKLAADDDYGRKLQDLNLIGNPHNRASTQKE